MSSAPRLSSSAAKARALDEATFPSLRGVAVEVDPWDDAKWARGAAALVLRATFAAPLYEHQIEDSVRARLPAASDRSDESDRSWQGPSAQAYAAERSA
jgi:hypothetical protein